MGLLNLDKKVNIVLDKEDFIPGDIINGKINFDFGLESLKLNKVTITFKKIIRREIENYSNGTYSTSTDITNTNILSRELLGEGEYRSENLDFKFQIPYNIFPRRSNFDKRLSMFLEKLKIKGFLKNLIELLVAFVGTTPSDIPTFELEARLDIPWGKDVVSTRQIYVYQTREEIEDEKKVLTEIAKDEGIYNEENKAKIDKM